MLTTMLCYHATIRHAGPFCKTCEPDQICPGGTTAAAKVCPVNAYPSFGATDVSQCYCKSGYGALGEGACR